MPDIGIELKAPASQQGIANRLRNLFATNQRDSSGKETPQQRREEMERNASDHPPLTQRDNSDRQLSSPPQTTTETNQPDAANRSHEADDRSEAPTADQAEASQPQSQLPLANPPRTEKQAIEAALNEKSHPAELERFQAQLRAVGIARITLINAQTITADRDPRDPRRKDAPLRYSIRPATMDEFRPHIESIATDLSSARSNERNNAPRATFRIDDGSNPGKPRTPDVFGKSPLLREIAMAQLPQKMAEGKQQHEVLTNHKDIVETFLTENATEEETAAFQKELLETGHAKLTLITAKTVTATRDYPFRGEVKYDIRPATMEEYKPHIERLEEALSSRQESQKNQSISSSNASNQATLTSHAQQIPMEHEPIDPELSDPYYQEKDPGLPPSVQARVDAADRSNAELDARTDLQPPGQQADLHVCGPNCNCAASSGSRKQGLQQALIELAAVHGAEHTTDATGKAVLTGADAETILRAVQTQAAAAEAAIQKVVRDNQRRAELEDSSLDQNQEANGKAPIALKLTEEQVQLLVSNEYPNEPEKAGQSVYKLIRDGEPVNILKESVQLDYSEDIKSFFARLDEAERPALLSKIQDLEKQDEREKRAPEQQRQKARSKDRERE